MLGMSNRTWPPEPACVRMKSTNRWISRGGCLGREGIDGRTGKLPVLLVKRHETRDLSQSSCNARIVTTAGAPPRGPFDAIRAEQLVLLGPHFEGHQAR